MKFSWIFFLCQNLMIFTWKSTQTLKCSPLTRSVKIFVIIFFFYLNIILRLNYTEALQRLNVYSFLMNGLGWSTLTCFALKFFSTMFVGWKFIFLWFVFKIFMEGCIDTHCGAILRLISLLRISTPFFLFLWGLLRHSIFQL